MLLIVALIFAALGSIVSYRKMHDLIAGYNTMPKKQQKQIDIEGIAILFRNVMYILAVILILGYLMSFWIDSKKFEAILIIVSVVLAVMYLIITSNSKKYRLEPEHCDDHKK